MNLGVEVPLKGQEQSQGMDSPLHPPEGTRPC